MIRYWLSWWQPGPDWRPLHVPVEGVIGYWSTGIRYVGEIPDHSICAVVECASELAVWACVYAGWPDAGEVRFIRQVEADWLPPEDRFPRSTT